MSRILITGGSGLIGRHLIAKLKERDHPVSVLTRGSSGERDSICFFHWDVVKGELDPAALVGVEIIIHLAGANIAGGRWTAKRKREIIDSRVQSAELLLRAIREKRLPLAAFISASGVGYYGAVTTDHIFRESDPPADDFMSTICRLWEQAADRFAELPTRVVKLRTGVVLTPRGGALAKMAAPVRRGLAAPLASGKQFLPWIHIDDLINLYVRAVEDDTISGVYNAVAPQYVTNAEFMRTLAHVLNKPFFMPPLPGFLLKIIFGEMACTILKGSRVAPERLVQNGFTFRHPDLDGALESVLRRA